MRYRCKAQILGLMVLLVTFASPAVTSAKSAYERLSTDTLSHTLQRLQMNTLLKALSDKTGDKTLKIESLLAESNATLDPVKRDKLLAEAATLIKQCYEELAKKAQDAKGSDDDTYEEALVKSYNTKMRYIDVVVMFRGKPYIDRMLFLLGGEEDRKELGKLTGEAVDLLKDIERDLAKDIRKSRRKAVFQVTLVPELEDVKLRLDYKSVFLRFYGAIALPKKVIIDGKEDVNLPRKQLLRDAIKSVQPFVATKEYGLKPYATLLEARCLRENGDYDKANEKLTWVIGPESKPGLVVEGLFEIVRNKVEQGAALVEAKQAAAGTQKFGEAEQAITKFVGEVSKVSSPIAADVKKLILEYYLYDNWASALRASGNAGQALKYDKKIQQAFLAFLKKYDDPGIHAQIGEMFATKFRGAGDQANLDPVILMLLAKMEATEADRLQAGNEFSALNAEAQKLVSDRRNKAKKMFESIRDSKKDSAQSAKPDVLWELGVIYVKQGRLPNSNFMAAEMFRQLASNFPRHPYAEKAALNAVRITNELIEAALEDGQQVTPKRRLEYVQALRLLLKNWGKNKDAALYHFDLAWQCDKLAATANSDEEYRKWVNEAIENYAKVPADSPQYLAAVGYGLENRYLLVKESKDKAAAEALRRDMLEYGRAMHEKWKAATDPIAKNDLGQWGGTAEFHADVLANEILGDKGALDRIEKLSARWPGTAALQESQEYAIRTRVERGDVNAAIGQLDRFEKTYGAKNAQGLMRLVVGKIRDTIRAMVASGKSGADVEKFRKAYLKFAEQIYNDKIASADEEQKYQITSLLADALVQSNQPANATKAIQLCEDLESIEEKRQAQQRSVIDEYINEREADLKAAGNNVESLKGLQGDFLKTLEQFELANWYHSKINNVKRSYAKLAKGEGNEVTVKYLVRSLRDSYKVIRKEALRRGTTIDASLLTCKAKAYMLLKKYPQAIAIYRKLAMGLSAADDPFMYWNVQLDLCQCLLEQAKSAEDSKRLMLYISQLREEDQNLGGRLFLSRFNNIEASARSKAGS